MALIADGHEPFLQKASTIGEKASWRHAPPSCLLIGDLLVSTVAAGMRSAGDQRIVAE